MIDFLLQASPVLIPLVIGLSAYGLIRWREINDVKNMESKSPLPLDDSPEWREANLDGKVE